MPNRHQPSFCRSFGLVALLLVGTWALNLGCAQKKESASGDGRLVTEKDFRDKVAELRLNKANITRRITDFERRKQTTLDLLKEKGIKSLSDVGDDPLLKRSVMTLKEYTDDIAKMKSDAAEYDKAIDRILAMLQEIDRTQSKDSVALSEDEYIRLRKIELDLNERLGLDKKDIFADEALENLLKKEMSGTSDQADSDKGSTDRTSSEKSNADQPTPPVNDPSKSNGS